MALTVSVLGSLNVDVIITRRVIYGFPSLLKEDDVRLNLPYQFICLVFKTVYVPINNI